MVGKRVLITICVLDNRLSRSKVKREHRSEIKNCHHTMSQLMTVVICLMEAEVSFYVLYSHMIFHLATVVLSDRAAGPRCHW